MLNQAILVGRLTINPVLEDKDNKKCSYITIAVPRSFKNANGEYETDFIKCTLWDAVARNTTEYCKKGDIIGIKGRIETYNDGNGIEIVAEKVTFLSSKNANDEGDL